MLPRLLFIALCLVVNTVYAGAITKNPQESNNQFAARYAPNAASTVVHVASAHAWGFEKPVIVAFYEYPVTYADKSRNYGDDPNDKEVLGVVFVPVDSSGYRKFDIDGYGPEGATAEIDSVFFTDTEKQSDKKLFVMVSWHNNAGTLYNTYVYEKPQLNASAGKLTFDEPLSRKFSGGCDCPSSDRPDRQARYRTASDVRAELKRLMK